MADLPKNHSETNETSEGSLQIQKKWRPEEYTTSFLEITLKIRDPSNRLFSKNWKLPKVPAKELIHIYLQCWHGKKNTILMQMRWVLEHSWYWCCLQLMRNLPPERAQNLWQHISGPTTIQARLGGVWSSPSNSAIAAKWLTTLTADTTFALSKPAIDATSCLCGSHDSHGKGWSRPLVFFVGLLE